MPYNQREKEIFNFLMNIVKLAVGINSISELRSKQEFKRKKYGNNNHITRLFPKKHIEIKNAGLPDFFPGISSVVVVAD